MPDSVQTDRMEIRLAGEGGQGMILAGIILAEAAALYDHKHAVQSQSYGPEARGGASKSEVIIAGSAIDFPEVIVADVLVALSQEAFDKYASNVRSDGLLILEADKVRTGSAGGAVRVPINRLALETTGKAITANIVALGVLVGLTRVVSPEAIEQAVTARAPKGTEAMNRLALRAGFAEAAKVQRVWREESREREEPASE